MRDFRDAKAMASTLREALAARGVALTHADCLELVSRVLGARDWNVLAALIKEAPAAPPPAPVWSGPMLPSRDFVLFPKQTAPLFVGREMSKRALAEAESGELEVLIVAQKDAADNDPAPDAIYRIGVIADLIDQTRLKDGSLKLTVRGRERARIHAVTIVDGRREADATPIRSSSEPGQAAAGKVLAAVRAFCAYAAARSELAAVIERIGSIKRPGVLADTIAQATPGDVAAKQALLETLDPLARLERAVRLIPSDTTRAA